MSFTVEDLVAWTRTARAYDMDIKLDVDGLRLIVPALENHGPVRYRIIPWVDLTEARLPSVRIIELNARMLLR